MIMKHAFAIMAVTCLIALPLSAQETESDPDNDRSLMERGAEMFFEGILREMEPAMRDLRGMAGEMGPALRDFVQEMGPAFAELMKDIEDLSAYHPPEMLPNGDIIMRRKTPEERGESPAPNEEIDI